MGRTLMFLSFLSIVITAVGAAFFGDSPLFWLVNDSNVYQAIRGLLASFMFLLLVTRPPRHIVFRVLSGMVGLVIVVWAIKSTLTNAMPILDSLCMLASALAIWVAALEVDTNKLQNQHPSGNSHSPLIA